MTRIIRADHHGPRLMDAALVDAHTRAARLLERAQRRAAEIIALAEASAADQLAEARAQGHEQGRAVFVTAAAELDRARDQTLDQLKPQLTLIAMAAAKHIVGRELESRPELAAQIAAPLIERLRRASLVRLRVHPSDAPLLELQLETLRDRAKLAGRLQIEPDPELSRGGCIAISEVGSLDATLDGRLQLLAHTLTQSERAGEP
jgi:type III secretion system HrpE/YscL family protein